MSGGRWDYSERHLEEIADFLSDENDLLLKATGNFLRDLQHQLRLFDRFLSQDSNAIDLNKLYALIPPSYLYAEMEKFRSALQFYAERDRYDYDETACWSPATTKRAEQLKQGVLEDNGETARKALNDQLRWR